MIRINQIKLPITHTSSDLEKKIRKLLNLSPDDTFEYTIVKRSIDARKKSDLRYVYVVEITIKNEVKLLKKVHNTNITQKTPISYKYPYAPQDDSRSRPIIVGCGPAGLFCAYYLAKAGLNPIVIERGEEASKRKELVDHFWNTGVLDTNSNVQFGEGGAGTFSDGKLNTLVKDPLGRNFEVLKIFVDSGAPNNILYEQKPHLGTDLLIDIVQTIRSKICSMGGSFLFNNQVTDLIIHDQQLVGVQLQNQQTFYSDCVVLAIGHSARDTFYMLEKNQIQMTAKSFAVGVRIEHPQEMINMSQYGTTCHKELGAAPYKLTCPLPNGRGVYSFCMCPGGYVVNASSEANHLAINGMSYHARNSENANSAMIVTVTPEDYGTYAHADTPVSLAGIEFQRHLESAAYKKCNGKIPVQLFGDFCKNVPSTSLGDIKPSIKGAYELNNVREILPDFIGDSLEQGITMLDHKIHGFSRYDALISGVESRTSSPVRIERNESLESSIKGLYPCGEGAGYAGGIMSAAMDGLKVAEVICKKTLK